MVKNSPVMQETQVQPLGREDPLKQIVTHSSILAWEESHGQRSLEGYSPWSHKTVGHNLVTKPPPPPLQPSSTLPAFFTLIPEHTPSPATIPSVLRAVSSVGHWSPPLYFSTAH